jgi:hypothetical protein
LPKDSGYNSTPAEFTLSNSVGVPLNYLVGMHELTDPIMVEERSVPISVLGGNNPNRLSASEPSDALAMSKGNGHASRSRGAKLSDGNGLRMNR